MTMSNRQKPTQQIVEEKIEVDPGMTAQDVADITSLNAPEPEYHTLLEIWTEVLSNSTAEAKKKVTPQWASKVVASYPDVHYADTPRAHALYHERIEELKAILAHQISTDDKALKRTSIDEDRVDNAVHYKNLLLLWQLAVQQWELDWDATNPDAAVDLVAISEVHKLFFGEVGLIAHLESINFDFTEDDQELLGQALVAQREGDGE